MHYLLTCVRALSSLFACRVRPFEVGGAKLLLTRDESVVHAVADKCSHYGAQLSKGSIKQQTHDIFHAQARTSMGAFAVHGMVHVSR